MPRTLTNKKDLPLPLYLAIRNDTYEARGHISTTSLIDAPLPRILKKYNQYEEDSADMIWSLVGQAMHAVVERVGDAFEDTQFLSEKKLMIKTTGNAWQHEVELSGTSDLIEIRADGKVILHDFKNIFVSVAKQGVASSAYKKWILQLNIYKYMISECLDMQVSEIKVHAFIRDWNRSRSEYTEGYPEYPVETFDIPCYSNKSMLEYIKKRIDLHFPQEELYRTGKFNEVETCSEEDRWARPEIWKMIKLGGKRSLKNFYIKDDADKINAKVYYELQSKKVEKLTIEIVPGEDVRCENYCPVNKFCKYYKAKNNGETKRPEEGAGTVAPEIQEPIKESKPVFKLKLR